LFVVGRASAGKRLGVKGLVEAKNGLKKGDKSGSEGATPVFLVPFGFEGFL
jgi:hypothetical protein